jgi:hypothetical protein
MLSGKLRKGGNSCQAAKGKNARNAANQSFNLMAKSTSAAVVRCGAGPGRQFLNRMAAKAISAIHARQTRFTPFSQKPQRVAVCIEPLQKMRSDIIPGDDQAGAANFKLRHYRRSRWICGADRGKSLLKIRAETEHVQPIML